MKYNEFTQLNSGAEVKYHDHIATFLKFSKDNEKALIAYGETKTWAWFYELEKM